MAGQGFLISSVNLFNRLTLNTNRLNFVNFQTPIRTLKVETRERLKSLKIPSKPKKPLSPYLQFITEKRGQLLKENPKIRQPEIIKQLSKDWQTVSAEQKAKYQEKYLKEMEDYDTEILKYSSNLSIEQRTALEDAQTEKRNDRKKRKLTKLLKETEKPKRPRGPYLLFLKEQSEMRNVSQHILMTQLKDEWAALSETEKKRFKDQYAKENEKYEIQLKEWEKKMVAEGHTDLVRVKSLPNITTRPSRVTTKETKKSTKE